MNRFISATLAGAIAVASVATSVGTADAGGYWQKGPGYGHGPGYGPPPGPPPGPYPGPRHGGGGQWGAALLGGAILGLALGTAFANEPPPPPRYAYYPPPPPPPRYAYYPPPPVYAQPQYVSPSLDQAHVDWCADTYPNYQPQTDTYMGYDGVIYRCVGPY